MPDPIYVHVWQGEQTPLSRSWVETDVQGLGGKRGLTLSAPRRVSDKSILIPDPGI